MIYLDYSATTPVNSDVLDSFNIVTKDYYGNPNSLHSLGVKSRELLKSARKQICDLLGIQDSELIITSSATDSNNRALIGTCLKHQHTGANIVVSKLEHPSIYNICSYIETLGISIRYVNNDKEGLIDLEDLKNNIDDKTVLVSICGINSEMGIRQPLRTIKQVITKKNKNTLFHSDLTQGLGKIKINLNDVDLASFSSHKIYAPRGLGILYKKNNINIIPLLYGSEIESLEIGTPPLALISSFSKALRLILSDKEEKEENIKECVKTLESGLKKYNRIKINRTKYCINQIYNISLMDIKSETFIHALEKHNIFVSSNTACSKGKISTTVMALYNDTLRASTTIRISISHLTTLKEIEEFLRVFDEEYNSLLTLVKGE